MSREIVFTDGAPAPIGPYSQAVSANGFLFVSGQIPLDPATGQMVQGSIAAETRQVMENVRAILKAANLDLPNVVKTSIFLTDMRDFAVLNEEYGKYFVKDPPARETVQVAGLPKGAHVELSVVAAY